MTKREFFRWLGESLDATLRIEHHKTSLIDHQVGISIDGTYYVLDDNLNSQQANLVFNKYSKWVVAFDELRGNKHP